MKRLIDGINPKYLGDASGYAGADYMVRQEVKVQAVYPVVKYRYDVTQSTLQQTQFPPYEEFGFFGRKCFIFLVSVLFLIWLGITLAFAIAVWAYKRYKTKQLSLQKKQKANAADSHRTDVPS